MSPPDLVAYRFVRIPLRRGQNKLKGHTPGLRGGECGRSRPPCTLPSSGEADLPFQEPSRSNGAPSWTPQHEKERS